jgi:hypothetical protein
VIFANEKIFMLNAAQARLGLPKRFSVANRACRFATRAP